MLYLIVLVNVIVGLLCAVYLGIKYLVLYIIERIKTPKVEVIYEEMGKEY